jgi:nucleoside-diphosphate-sugar epimerase
MKSDDAKHPKNGSISCSSVVVIGGAGFLGSHLVDHLIEDCECQVLILDNFEVGRLEFVNSRAMARRIDISTPSAVDDLIRMFNNFDAEYVFNYAAHPYIPLSFSDPMRVFMTNAIGAMNVMLAVEKTASVKGMLQVSSAELYGGVVGPPGSTVDEPCRIDEDDPIQPHSTYGAAKAAIDFYVQARWREAQTPCIALRQFNCVGERETHPYIVPEIISQLTQQTIGARFLATTGSEFPDKRVAAKPDHWNMEGVVYLGNNSTRDFLYAGDAVRMAVELLEKGEFGEVYNLGSEDGIKIYDLAKMIGKLMGFADVKVEQDQARVRPWEIWHLQSDNSKIYQVLGRFGRTSLEDALRRTINYYQKNGCRWGWEDATA